MKSIKLANSSIHIPDIINGLTSERAKVKKLYSKIRPDIVAMQVSEMELEGLKRIVEGEEFEYFLSNYEEVYAKKLASFGEVKVPPPCYEAAMKLCLRDGIQVIPIDMDDLYYADVFCESVSTWDLIRHSLRVKKLMRKKFKAKTAEEFVLEWDREINRLKGFRNLETKREEYMANELKRLAQEHERILCVMEMQRAAGVFRRLNERDHSSGEREETGR